jgi:hypothetical protein
MNLVKKTIVLRLTVDVTFDLGDTDVSELKNNMLEISHRAYSEALFTGGTGAEIETWGAQVEVVEVQK